MPRTESSGTCVFRLWERDWRQGWPGKKGRFAKKMDQMYGPLRWGEQLYRLTQTMLPELTTFLSFLSFLSSSFFSFFLSFFPRAPARLIVPTRGSFSFRLINNRLIIEAKFPQITMKHGVINVRCVRGNRVIYVSYTLGHGLAASRRSFADAPIGPVRILNFTRFVSRLDLAAAFKFE